MASSGKLEDTYTNVIVPTVKYSYMEYNILLIKD